MRFLLLTHLRSTTRSNFASCWCLLLANYVSLTAGRTCLHLHGLAFRNNRFVSEDRELFFAAYQDQITLRRIPPVTSLRINSSTLPSPSSVDTPSSNLDRSCTLSTYPTTQLTQPCSANTKFAPPVCSVLSLFHRSTNHGRCVNRRSTPRHQWLHPSQRPSSRINIETPGSSYKFLALELHYNRHLHA